MLVFGKGVKSSLSGFDCSLIVNSYVTCCGKVENHIHNSFGSFGINSFLKSSLGCGELVESFICNKSLLSVFKSVISSACGFDLLLIGRGNVIGKSVDHIGYSICGFEVCDLILRPEQLAKGNEGNILTLRGSQILPSLSRCLNICLIGKGSVLVVGQGEHHIVHNLGSLTVGNGFLSFFELFKCVRADQSLLVVAQRVISGAGGFNVSLVVKSDHVGQGVDLILNILCGFEVDNLLLGVGQLLQRIGGENILLVAGQGIVSCSCGFDSLLILDANG